MNASEIRARIAGRRVVLSLSGGADSAAASLYLHELGIEHDRVFADTGWEHPDTIAHVAYLAERLGPVATVRGPLLMADLIRSKGMFPSRKHRFCTSMLKVRPLLEHMAHLGEDELVNAIGIRADESAERAGLAEWEENPTLWANMPAELRRMDVDVETWRPIIRWSKADVIAIHQRHQLKPNPLYLRGASRVGCWPCINAKKAEIRHIAEIDPARIDAIRDLEQEVTEAAVARMSAKGTTLDAEGFMEPTFFQAPMQEEATPEAVNRHARRAMWRGRPWGCAPASAPRIRGMWSIDRVVGWSKTSRGGVHLELFAAPNDGCARWGMCEQLPAR